MWPRTLGLKTITSTIISLNIVFNAAGIILTVSLAYDRVHSYSSGLNLVHVALNTINLYTTVS